MANVLTNLYNGMLDGLAQRIASYIPDARGRGYNILGDYYNGDQRKQLIVKQDPKTLRVIDDNIIQNWVRLVTDRSTSRLYKGGVKFKLPEGSDAQQEYLDQVWNLAKQEILLYQLGIYGANYGTCFVRINPQDAFDPFTGKEYTSIKAVHPNHIRVFTAPDNVDEVEKYVIEFSYTKEKDNRAYEVCEREIIKHADNEQGEGDKDTWVIERWKQEGGGVWKMEGEPIAWDYDFPPVLHWKNLPSLYGAYGNSEIDDVINVQDKSNFVVSNESKIIKFHASPTTIISGTTSTGMEKSPDGLVVLPDKEAKAYNLEMQSDLASSRALAESLRQSIFSIAREVDISSMSDKLGALTNFGLRVLYSDALEKNDTKRQLYGDAFKELNRRLLVLNGWEGEMSRPGDVVWGEAMTINILEELQADQIALELGVIDKETIIKRYQMRYGVDYETVLANIEQEKSAANANSANIGAQILRNFNQGVQQNPMVNNGTQPATANQTATR